MLKEVHIFFAKCWLLIWEDLEKMFCDPRFFPMRVYRVFLSFRGFAIESMLWAVSSFTGQAILAIFLLGGQEEAFVYGAILAYTLAKSESLIRFREHCESLKKKKEKFVNLSWAERFSVSEAKFLASTSLGQISAILGEGVYHTSNE